MERLAALLHDAPEYVIGDMISPFKAAIGLDYKAFEARLRDAIHIRFDLPPELPASLETLIKRADRLAAWFEATQLAGFSQAGSPFTTTHPFEGSRNPAIMCRIVLFPAPFGPSSAKNSPGATENDTSSSATLLP